MLIEQIIKKQTISILDKLLQFYLKDLPKQGQQNGQSNEGKYTAEEFCMKFVKENVIKEDQRQVLLILVNKFIESENQEFGGKDGEEKKFGEEQGRKMVESIKRSIIDEERGQNSPIKSDSKAQNEKQNKNQQATQVTQPFQQSNPSQILPPPSFQPPIQHLSQLSIKLKKQSQFITRNIARIKTYSTHLSHPTIPYSPPQLQQTKISHEISHKLFHIYRAIYPSTTNKQVETNNFQSKEQYRSTLNYHKILEMFVDAAIKLQIENKLALLRVIKKFAFNQNFVTIQEWTKIYRAIVHSLGVKEVVLQRLVKQKEEEKKLGKFVMPMMQGQNAAHKEDKQPQNVPASSQYRTRRIKTQTSLPQPSYMSQPPIPNLPSSQYHNKTDLTINKSAIRPINPDQKTEPKSYNPNEYRSRHKKLITDVSEVFIKNVKRELRSEKMVGLVNNNDQDRKNEDGEKVGGGQGKHEYSYLKKAIKGKKIGKVTWETLFQMKQDTMYHNIVIPQFAKNIDEEDVNF